MKPASCSSRVGAKLMWGLSLGGVCVSRRVPAPDSGRLGTVLIMYVRSGQERELILLQGLQSEARGRGFRAVSLPTRRRLLKVP